MVIELQRYTDAEVIAAARKAMVAFLSANGLKEKELAVIEAAMLIDPLADALEAAEARVERATMERDNFASLLDEVFRKIGAQTNHLTERIDQLLAAEARAERYRTALEEGKLDCPYCGHGRHHVDNRYSPVCNWALEYGDNVKGCPCAYSIFEVLAESREVQE